MWLIIDIGSLYLMLVVNFWYLIIHVLEVIDTELLLVMEFEC